MSEGEARGKYEDRLLLSGDELVIFQPDGKVLGVYPHWKGKEFMTDSNLLGIEIRFIGQYVLSRMEQKQDAGNPDRRE